jgi:hypothetical protein
VELEKYGRYQGAYSHPGQYVLGLICLAKYMNLRTVNFYLWGIGYIHCSNYYLYV